MPPGTYWSDEHDRYLQPDDPDWTREGYETAENDRWPFDDGTVH